MTSQRPCHWVTLETVQPLSIFHLDGRVLALFTWASGAAEILLEAPGAYGSRSNAVRLASYETASALASRPSPDMGGAEWHVPGARHPALPPNLQTVVGPFVSTGRSSPRTTGMLWYSRMPLSPADRGIHHSTPARTTGKQYRVCRQGPNCIGTSIASSCLQYALRLATSRGRYTASMYWSIRTALRPLRTSTNKVVYAPVSCCNSPAISSYGARSI
ncbi:unnamed protein product [Leuciscus chuanchicus]